MHRIKLGYRLESLGLPLRKALEAAERLGVAGVQFDALGDLSPTRLGETGRRELRNLLRAHNLALTALGCPLRRGLDVAEDLQPRIERIREVMRLCYELGAKAVIVQAGKVPEDDADPRGFLMREALLDLGRHGDRVGAILALETGLESGERLRQFLDQFDTGGLGVNLDPANLLLNGFDLFEGTRALCEKVVHVHAKDARAARASRGAQEVPLGHGDIDWMEFLGLLEEIEYRGWLTIERESGERLPNEPEASVAFLRRIVG